MNNMEEFPKACSFPSLHEQIIINNLDGVKFLLDHGANVNEKTFLGLNALHLAVKHSSVEVARLLLGSIEDINEKTNDDSTALHYAAENSTADKSDIEITELLLKSGADINAENINMKSPLDLALKLKRFKLAAYLLSFEESYLHFCRQIYSTGLSLKNCKAKLRQLILHEKNVATAKENSLLIALRLFRKSDERLIVVNRLLDNEVKLDISNTSGITALQIAIEDSDKNLAMILIERSCSVNLKTLLGGSILHKSVLYNVKKLTNFLLENGVNVNGYGPYGHRSALQIACEQNNEAMVHLLLKYNTDVNLGTKTLIFTAITRSNFKIMKILIENGVNINCKDTDGSTPLRQAIKFCGIDKIRKVKYLLNLGARINEKDHYGDTLLHEILMMRRRDEVLKNILSILLSQGADINIENNNKHTAMYFGYVCEWDEISDLRILIEHIAIMQSQHLYINPRNLYYKGCLEYLNSCLLEIEQMKHVKIDGKYSCFDVLTKSYNTLVPLLQVESTIDTLKTIISVHNFRIYRA